MYFCNARYYVPEWCRWLSQDSVNYIDPDSADGLNLFAYCNNNPVMYADPSGHSSVLTGLAIAALIGAIVGAASYAASEVISYSITQNWSWSWGSFLGSVLGGIVSGIFSYATSGMGSWVAFMNGGISTTFGLLFENAFGEAEHSVGEIIGSSIRNAVLAGIADKFTSFVKIKGITGRGSISQIHKQVYSKLRNNVITGISKKTFGKLLLHDLFYSALNGTVNGLLDARDTIKDINKRMQYFEIQF